MNWLESINRKFRRHQRLVEHFRKVYKMIPQTYDDAQRQLNLLDKINQKIARIL